MSKNSKQIESGDLLKHVQSSLPLFLPPHVERNEDISVLQISAVVRVTVRNVAQSAF